MLDQPYMTDLIEANSMGLEPNLIDIYSASWGPTDDGKTVDGPRNATMKAIVRGVNEVQIRCLRSIASWVTAPGHYSPSRGRKEAPLTPLIPILLLLQSKLPLFSIYTIWAFTGNL